MRTAEDIIKHFFTEQDKLTGRQIEWVKLIIEQERKETSIEFFKWNAKKENYSAFLRNNPSNRKQYEKEFEEAEYFDCLTPEERYNLFIKDQENG